MPAVSESQQRLFGMVHAYQKGKLKHAPKKIRDVAKHISKEDAKHFAETKHEGLPERKKKDNEKDAAAKGTPVTVTVGKKSFTFPSKKSAILYLAALPTISPAEAETAIRERADGLKSILLSYPEG